MNSLFIAYLVICGALPCACTLAGWLLHDWWRGRRDRPVPYVPTAKADDALGYRQVRSMLDDCTWCKPVPRGLCSCAARCGHVRCVHLPGRGWTARDRDILEGKKSL